MKSYRLRVCLKMLPKGMLNISFISRDGEPGGDMSANRATL